MSARLPDHPGLVIDRDPARHYEKRAVEATGAIPLSFSPMRLQCHVANILAPKADDKAQKAILKKKQELSIVDKKACLLALKQNGWKALDNIECLLFHLHMFAKAPPHEASELFQAILLTLKRKEKHARELSQIHPEELVLIAKACHARKIDCKEFLRMFSGVLIKTIAQNRLHSREMDSITFLLVENGIVATLSGHDLCLLVRAYQSRKDSSKELFQHIFNELQKDSWKKLAILTSKEILSLTAAFSEKDMLTPEFTEVLMCKCYNLTLVSSSSRYTSSQDADRG